ncbi:hypothetical protein KP509_16G036500 [Ceratopteris richardii]|uniref:Uncharacterized protein n=1 Tax=Ceratopteris richardii TaxID=49495 RepID=A0A8T2T1J5_CERRI|nr:hypothetical protein KP509_16G036500 [Ceratopteris richardii]
MDGSSLAILPILRGELLVISDTTGKKHGREEKGKKIQSSARKGGACMGDSATGGRVTFYGGQTWDAHKSLRRRRTQGAAVKERRSRLFLAFFDRGRRSAGRTGHLKGGGCISEGEGCVQ